MPFLTHRWPRNYYVCVPESVRGTTSVEGFIESMKDRWKRQSEQFNKEAQAERRERLRLKLESK